MSIVLSGDGVVLRFPFPEEHEHLIAIRNQQRVWFGDRAKISLKPERLGFQHVRTTIASSSFVSMRC
jgi:hypothetical protein